MELLRGLWVRAENVGLRVCGFSKVGVRVSGFSYYTIG